MGGRGGRQPTSISVHLSGAWCNGAVLTDWAAACATPAVSCLDALCACFTEYLLTIHSHFSPGMKKSGKREPGNEFPMYS